MIATQPNGAHKFGYSLLMVPSVPAVRHNNLLRKWSLFKKTAITAGLCYYHIREPNTQYIIILNESAKSQRITNHFNTYLMIGNVYNLNLKSNEKLDY